MKTLQFSESACLDLRINICTELMALPGLKMIGKIDQQTPLHPQPQINFLFLVRVPLALSNHQSLRKRAGRHWWSPAPGSFRIWEAERRPQHFNFNEHFLHTWKFWALTIENLNQLAENILNDRTMPLVNMPLITTI